MPPAHGAAAAQWHQLRQQERLDGDVPALAGDAEDGDTAQQVGFQEYLHVITEATARIARLEQALRDALSDWSFAPLVQALQALSSVQLIAAMTLVAELQDFLRFDSPRKVMAYVGLVPGEHSSGAKRCQGNITKAGRRWLPKRVRA